MKRRHIRGMSKRKAKPDVKRISSVKKVTVSSKEVERLDSPPGMVSMRIRAGDTFTPNSARVDIQAVIEEVLRNAESASTVPVFFDYDRELIVPEGVSVISGRTLDVTAAQQLQELGRAATTAGATIGDFQNLARGVPRGGIVGSGGPAVIYPSPASRLQRVGRIKRPQPLESYGIVAFIIVFLCFILPLVFAK